MFSGPTGALQDDHQISSLPAQHTQWAAQVHAFQQNPLLLMAQKFWEYDEKQKLPHMSQLLNLEGNKGQ